jgi:hypothetical protein
MCRPPRGRYLTAALARGALRYYHRSAPAITDRRVGPVHLNELQLRADIEE